MLALETYDQMVFSVQTQLAQLSGTLDLRRALLENAKVGLQKLLDLLHDRGWRPYDNLALARCVSPRWS